MVKEIMKGLGFGLAVLILSSCTGSPGIRARSYFMDKERVDQEMKGGNFGYLRGTPVPEDRKHFKKTRKIYVLEITKDVDEPEEVKAKAVPAARPAPSQKQPTAASQRPLPDWAKPIPIPSFKEEKVPEKKAVRTSAGGETFVVYTVQKEDTLQKISKKFYDSYSKWPKIYEENKEVIKNPNKIKPGIELKVPVDW